MELWKFGDYKHYTSIKLLAALFDIPTPKDDIDGSQVSRVYWQEKDLERIKIYCQKDTLTVAQLLLKYMGKELILPGTYRGCIIRAEDLFLTANLMKQ